MKRNRIVIIVVILLGIAAFALWYSRSTGTFMPDSEFSISDTASVTRIFISDKNNNTVTLNRLSTGVWDVNGKYPAQMANVNLLLKTMLQIEVQYPVPKTARNNIITEMAVNAVKVEIYQRVYRVELFGLVQWFPHEKATRVYYVGGATPNNLGCFMLLQGASKPYVVVQPGFRGFVSPRYSPIEKYWRNYNVFNSQVPAIASVRVEIPETPSYSFEVKNLGKGRFSLTALDGNRQVSDYDTLKLLNFLAGFRNLNYEALLNDMDKARKDSITSSQPFIIITLTDTSGVATTVKTFHKSGSPGQTDPDGNPLPYDPDRLYALVNEGRDFTLIQYFTFGRVLRPLPFFLN